MFVQKFLARQPIFNSQQAVYGYELLYRSGPTNSFGDAQPDHACASTLDSALLFGIDRLIPGCRAFVNCTRDSLLREFPTNASPRSRGHRDSRDRAGRRRSHRSLPPPEIRGLPSGAGMILYTPQLGRRWSTSPT
jgi:hypothetical protein